MQEKKIQKSFKELQKCNYDIQPTRFHGLATSFNKLPIGHFSDFGQEKF